jgi:putative protease
VAPARRAAANHARNPELASAQAAPETASPLAAPAGAPGESLAACLAVLASEPVRTGVVRRYFARGGVALVALEAPLAAGDSIHVRGATSDFLATVTSLRVGGSPVPRATSGDATIALPERARPGDLVYALRGPA